MSKKQNRKMRVNQRWNLFYQEVDNFFETLKYESFMEWKEIMESELIRLVKKYNIAAYNGSSDNWTVNTSIDPVTNRYSFDIQTNDGWRVVPILHF